jgi:hypothetical protein
LEEGDEGRGSVDETQNIDAKASGEFFFKGGRVVIKVAKGLEG